MYAKCIFPKISVKQLGKLKGAVHKAIQTCIISKQADRASRVFDYIIDINEKQKSAKNCSLWGTSRNMDQV